MAVQDQLRTEGGIAAHADRHMTPFAIHDVEVIMLDERPLLAVTDFCNLPSGIAFDFPDRRRRIASDHQEQAAKGRTLGHVRLGQLVLALPRSRLDDRNPLPGAEGVQAAGECACHLSEMLVIQLRVVPVKSSPPAAHATAGLPHGVEGIEDDAIHAIVDPLQQLGVVLREVIGRVHARPLARFAAVSHSCSRQRTTSFPVKSGKGPRTLPESFSTKQIGQIEIFADQALIAIENSRLLEAEQTRTREFAAELEQQTTTAEILRIIARSPTDPQPVFDTIMQSAVRLCGARHALVYRLEGEMIQLVGHHNFLPDSLEPFRRTLPHRLSESGTLVAQAMRSGKVVAIKDIFFDADVSEAVRELARSAGYRSVIAVPILREGRPLGAIALTRGDEGCGPNPFSREQIKLLEMFAGHVGIAIENAQLFEEVQARTRELSKTLEHQTTTSEILRIISSSPTDAQPVFDAIMQSAVRLCGARHALIYQVEDEMIHLVGHHNFAAEPLEQFRRTLPHRLSESGTLVAQAMRSGKAVAINDILYDADVSEAVRELARSAGYRSVIAVPILREGRPLGAIALTRSDERGAPNPFSQEQMMLLEIFAGHVGIAIENARLFEEVQARTRELSKTLEHQTTTSEILRIISSSPTDAQPV